MHDPFPPIPVPAATPKRDLGTRQDRRSFSQKMQHIAINYVDPVLWPDYKPFSVEAMGRNELARIIDISGTDKILVHPNGHTIHVSERFRQYSDYFNFPQFTLRDVEYERHISAAEQGGNLPFYFKYCYATEDEADIFKLYLVRYAIWIKNIVEGLTAPPKKKLRPHDEDFYYVPWKEMPYFYIANEIDGPFVTF